MHISFPLVGIVFTFSDPNELYKHVYEIDTDIFLEKKYASRVRAQQMILYAWMPFNFFLPSFVKGI